MPDSKYQTIGGQVTAGETFVKVIDLLDQLMDQLAMMAHVTRAQGSKKDAALADGWLALVEMFKRVRFQVTKLAEGRMQ